MKDLFAIFSLGEVFCLLAAQVNGAEGDKAAPPSDLWTLANHNRSLHRFSTLFTSHDVRDRLSTPEGIGKAIDWCKKIGVTKVYIEEFRDGYQADRAALFNAKQEFQKQELVVSGCVTTTQLGKQSTGWKLISCYTDMPTQEKVQAIFEYAAGLFDEIMIDDFWFSDCTCVDCDTARKAKTVTVGKNVYSVASDSWEDYHHELMVRVSQDRVLAAAKKVNPNARLIIKYPQWYDGFHERGYEVLRQSADFDTIWVGTESRDYNDSRWGGKTQYESYFIMRWLGGIGGEKCGGGWYDWLGTTEATYLEQARQTVLAGAGESMLFCYGGLQGSTGPKDIQTLRANIPELFSVAQEVRGRSVIGLAAYKPANSHGEKEKYIFDFVGMLGLPLVPCHEFPVDAPAAFFSVHALKDQDFTAKLAAFIAAGKPVLLTDSLSNALGGKIDLNKPSVHVLNVKADPKSLLTWSQSTLDELRPALLTPFKTSFRAPNRVALYLFRDGSWVIENFNETAAVTELNGTELTVPARGWRWQWNSR